MPSRSIKNRTRGNQRGPKAEGLSGDLGPPDAINKYDGRANTNAGVFEQSMRGDAEPSGHPIYWINGKKAQ